MSDRKIWPGADEPGSPYGAAADRLSGLSSSIADLERQISAQGPVREPRRVSLEMWRIQQELEEMGRELHDLTSTQRQALRRACRSATRAALILEMVPLAVLSVGADSTIVDANAQAVRLLNVSRRHLIGRRFALFLAGERECFLKRLADLTEGRCGGLRLNLTIRPRERRALVVNVVGAVQEGQRALLVLGRHAGTKPDESRSDVV